MSLLGLSLAIGVLIDDAIVVRENIVRHMERGADRRTAALNGHRRDRPGGGGDHLLDHRGVHAGGLHAAASSGEWFRPVRADGGGLGAGEPVHLASRSTRCCRPTGATRRASARSAEDAASAGCCERFNDWFDHQADRYGSVIAWALHHRTLDDGCSPSASFVGAIALQVKFGGSSFLPDVRRRHDRDRRAHAVVEQPGVRARSRSKAAADAGAHDRRRPRRPTATSTPSGGRVYVDIGKSTQRKRSACEIARRAAHADWRAWSAPSTSCSTT